MGIIYSAGMSCNSFDVAPAHGRTPFYVDAKHDGDNIDGANVWDIDGKKYMNNTYELLLTYPSGEYNFISHT